jgi:hypothetical protein
MKANSGLLAVALWLGAFPAVAQGQAASRPPIGQVVTGCEQGGCRLAPVPATCRVRNALPSGVAYLGSGTLVVMDGQTIVLTCQHLFREAAGVVTVTFADGRQAAVGMIYHNAAWDLAGLELELENAPPGIEPVPIGETAPRKGDPVAGCGYGPNGQYACTQGRVTGYVRVEGTDTFDTLEMSGATREGDSGGPVFNQRGELVAVLWGTDKRTAGGTCCPRIRLFLRNLFGVRQRPGRNVYGPKQAAPSACAPAAGQDAGCCPPSQAAQPTQPWQIKPPGTGGGIALPSPIEEAAPPAPIAGKPAPISEKPAPDSNQPILEAIRDLREHNAEAIRRPILKAIEGLSGNVTAAADGLATRAAPGVAESILPAALAALGWTGPPAIAAGLLGTALLKFLTRRAQQRLIQKLSGAGAGQPAAPAPDASATAWAVPQPAAVAQPAAVPSAGPVIVQQTPPLPQKTVVQQEYVPYEAPSLELRALQWAMADCARRYPGSVSTIETIRSYADQYQSGQKPLESKKE